MTSDDLAAPELLPCPFCGCTTIVKATGRRATVPFYECDWCDAEGPAEEPEADPPQGWNVRATPATPAASPEVAKLIQEAEARGMERAAMRVRAWRDEAVHPTHYVNMLLAEAAALKGKTK